MDYLLLPLAFFVIALLYASAGFGGGSSYLAVLSLTGLPVGGIRPIALICNLVVTGSSSVTFARAGITPWRRALPLVAASMPAAFLGGRILLPREQYLLLLGALLLVAAALMILQKGARPQVQSESSPANLSVSLIALGIGALVGFVSGVVGIGGGIFLSPILFLGRWAGARQIAATTSLFIALNSLAGLAGQLSVGISFDYGLTALLVVAVLIGGTLGTRLTLRRLAPASIRKIAALLILFVALRLVMTNWPF